jgi:cation-transporting P-type ATPase C
MSQIIIKSVANNRVRLKSSLFANRRNLNRVEEQLAELFVSLRTNYKCQSIIFVHSSSTPLDDIIAKIEKLFALTPSIKLSPVTANTVCGSSTSCNRCEIKPQKQIPWRRKLIEFGLLTGYAIYIFVKENIMGVALNATPFSLVAGVALVAALPLLKDSYEDIKQGRFTLETFMGGTMVLAIFFGEATAAFEIIYILRGGMLLEDYIATKSKNEIYKLVEIDIKKVFIRKEDIELEVDMNEVVAGDIVVAREGDKIPVDGVIVSGEAAINEALINGRSTASMKKEGESVFAGTLIDSGRIDIEVRALGSSTYISRVMSDVEKSLAFKSSAQLEADRLAQKLLKLGTILTISTFVVTGSLLRAFSVMIVMSCPCATVLAASTAVSAGVANGAKNGILIKGGEALEQVAQSDVFCFDKTGTLTTGEPIVIEMMFAPNTNKDRFLEIIAAMEYRNAHPIAKAIVTYAQQEEVNISQEANSEILTGLGVVGSFEEHDVVVGNRKLLEQRNITLEGFKWLSERYFERGHSVVYLVVDGVLWGLLVLEHEVREGTKEMIEILRQKGVKHIALLTGDEERVATSFALNLGFDKVYANQSPHDKARAIDELKERYKGVVMVGDGVNDTLAMSKADVGISFAAGGSKAAIEVSDIAITHSHPEDVTYLYDLSKKTLKVVNQNYWIGTGTNLGGVALASVGLLSPVAAGAIHIGHTVAIMANSSKLTFGNAHTNNRSKK